MARASGRVALASRIAGSVLARLAWASLPSLELECIASVLARLASASTGARATAMVELTGSDL
jgi:hypothetical protein